MPEEQDQRDYQDYLEYQDYLDHQDYEDYVRASEVSTPTVSTPRTQLERLNPFTTENTDRINASASDYLDRFGKNLVAAANTAFPFADEIAANQRVGINKIKGWFGAEPSWGGGTYEDQLAAIRGGEKAHEEQFPYQAGASKLIGAVTAGATLPTGIAGRASLVGKGLQAAGEGAGYGGYWGFAEGEGGLDERLANAKHGAKVGALVAPAATGVLEVAAKPLSYAARKLLPPSIEDQRLSSLGFSNSELKKAGRFRPKGPADEPGGVVALRGIKDRGVFSSGETPTEWLANSEAVVEDLSTRLSGVLKEADAAQVGVPTLDFSAAENFIRKHIGDEDALRKQMAERLATLNKHWDGTVSGLSEMKTNVFRSAFGSETSRSQGLDRAMRTDLKRIVEQEADNLVPHLVDEVRGVNAQLSEHHAANDILENASTKQWRDTLRGGSTKDLEALLRKIGSRGLIAGAAEVATGIPLTKAGLALGAIEHLAGSPRARSVFSAAAGKGGAFTRALGEEAGVLSTVVSPDAEPNEPRQEARRVGPSSAPAPRQLPDQPPKRTASPPTTEETPTYKQAPEQASRGLLLSDTGSPIMPVLSRAVERVESGGRADAVSPRGAIGSHQVMPIAMRDVLRSQGIDDKPYSDAELRQIAKMPGQSKAFGEAYLGSLLEKYNDVPLALAAYNGGPSMVDQLLRKPGADSFDDIKADLPKESRDYVKKIFRALSSETYA